MITSQNGPRWTLQMLTYNLTNTFRLGLIYHCITNSDVPHICLWKPWNRLCVPMPSACPSRLPFTRVKGFLKLLKCAKIESCDLPRNVQCPVLWNARRVWGGKIRAKACNCGASKSSQIVVTTLRNWMWILRIVHWVRVLLEQCLEQFPKTLAFEIWLIKTNLLHWERHRFNVDLFVLYLHKGHNVNCCLILRNTFMEFLVQRYHRPFSLLGPFA